jgi:hypothetical protein
MCQARRVAPWYVIPPGHERFAYVAAGASVVETLLEGDPR